MDKHYYVYIMSNRINTVLYTGVTNDLKKRVWEHKQGLGGGFSKRYEINKLLYYEATGSVESAILREKRIKGGSRHRKETLINSLNPEWRDLYQGL